MSQALNELGVAAVTGTLQGAVYALVGDCSPNAWSSTRCATRPG